MRAASLSLISLTRIKVRAHYGWQWIRNVRRSEYFRTVDIGTRRWFMPPRFVNVGSFGRWNEWSIRTLCRSWRAIGRHCHIFGAASLSSTVIHAARVVPIGIVNRQMSSTSRCGRWHMNRGRARPRPRIADGASMFKCAFAAELLASSLAGRARLGVPRPKLLNPSACVLR